MTEVEEAPSEPRIPDDEAVRLFAARKRVRDSELSYHAADLERKDRKASLDAAQEGLNRLIDSIEAGPGPLFTETAAPDDWRAVSIEMILGPGRIANALAENVPALLTLGDLTDWQTLKGDIWAKDVQGLGPKAVETLDEATAKFWGAHPEFCKDADGPDGDASDQDD